MTHHPSPFLRFSATIADLSGKPVAFLLALLLIVVWAGSGPFFGFSETWQMLVNTGTTIITFLMVFLLQNAQNRDNRAIQAKLDELILTSNGDNRFVGVENLDAEELRKVSVELVEKAGTRIDESPLDQTDSVEVNVQADAGSTVQVDTQPPGVTVKVSNQEG